MPLEFWEFNSPLLFCPLSVSHCPSWQWFYWCEMFSLGSLLGVSWEFTSLDKRFLPRSFLGNLSLSLASAEMVESSCQPGSESPNSHNISISSFKVAVPIATRQQRREKGKTHPCFSGHRRSDTHCFHSIPTDQYLLANPHLAVREVG